MNTEINRIIDNLLNVFSGDPWYGKSISAVLEEVQPELVYEKPAPDSHSIIELIYHMTDWSTFACHRLEKINQAGPPPPNTFAFSMTNLDVNTWNNGIAQFTAFNNKIITLLRASDDSLLEETVEFRTYNFRYMLEGLIQHNIYHLGQIIYLHKLLVSRNAEPTA